MMPQNTILVVDDEQPVRQVISTLLETEGFKVIQAPDGKSCLKIAYETHPDLVLLDILMPGKDGREVCRLLRQVSSDIGIIMLTALSEDLEKVQRFNDGADDYVTKPFHNEELIARIRAVLRRIQHTPTRPAREYHDSMLRVNFETHELMVNGAEASISPKQWRLLECLVTHQDHPVMREDLLRFAWGPAFEKEFKYLKVFVSHLRRNLGDDPKKPRYIHTVREQGYLFQSHT
jgi:DNA-binding response OmpR family regulator